jgi:23S rRNA pseudouridine2605 synthase
MPQKKRTPFRPPQKKTTEDKAAISDESSDGARKARRFQKTKPHAVDSVQSEVPPKGPTGRRGRMQTEVAERHERGGGRSAFPAQAADVHSEKLQKVLAQAGVGSRRDMEVAIVAGRVRVNGIPATIGTRVTPHDRIQIDGRPVRKSKPDRLPRILIYHKPEEEIVSRDDPEGRASVFDSLPRVKGGKWISVGRLDYNTSGLLIFTTSGDLANRLSHPRFEVEREYAVRVMGELSEEQCATLCSGVQLQDGMAKFEWLREEGGAGANHWYRVMLREGRNREVRRMFEAIGVMVSRLMRVRFGMINLPSHVKRGAVKELDEKQVKDVLDWAGVVTGDAAPAGSPRPVGARQQPERRPLPRNPRAGQTRSRVQQRKR